MKQYLDKLLRRANHGPVVRTWLVTGVELLLAALREIFDESAYARFLVRRRMVSSCEAYTEFLREHELAKARRPRCC
jgi:hypothetical protein